MKEPAKLLATDKPLDQDQRFKPSIQSTLPISFHPIIFVAIQILHRLLPVPAPANTYLVRSFYYVIVGPCVFLLEGLCPAIVLFLWTEASEVSEWEGRRLHHLAPSSLA